MGADISSCCSTEPSKDKQTISEKGEAKTAKPSQVDVDKFQRRVEMAVEILVLLADGSSLPCQLKLNSDDKSLMISCEKPPSQKNYRVIPLSELRAVLHGRDALKRVETKANLVDDPNCVALHMNSGNCIPVRFETIEDKQAFVELMKKLK